MRLIYAYDEVLPSSATDTEQVVNTVSALSRAGVDVELAVPRVDGGSDLGIDALRRYYQVDGSFRVVPVASRFDGRRAMQKVAHAVGVMRQLKRAPDVVWYTRNLPCLAAGLAAGYPTVFEHWRPWPDQYPPLEPVLRGLMTHPRFLGAVLHSDYARKSYERLGISPSRLRTIHNGYEPNRMEPRLTKDEARRRLGLPLDANIAVYAGRVHENKGLDSLLGLARRCPNVTLMLVGSEGEGAIERRARSLKNMRIAPWQTFSETVVFLYAADVLLLPLTVAALEVHKTAALPMKLFQYLASGRAVLAPRAPDLLELLSDSNAALVPPDDEEAAAQALTRLFERPEERARIERAGYETARELTWARRADKIVDFIEERREIASVADGKPWSLSAWATRSVAWALATSLPR